MKIIVSRQIRQFLQEVILAKLEIYFKNNEIRSISPTLQNFSSKGSTFLIKKMKFLKKNRGKQTHDISIMKSIVSKTTRTQEMT